MKQELPEQQSSARLWKKEYAICPAAEDFLFLQGDSCTVDTQIPSRQEAKIIILY